MANKKEMHELTGLFWLNEQDSYEPTGIRYRLPYGHESHDLADLLESAFGCQKLGFDGDQVLDPNHKPVKLKISISKED